MHDKGMSTHNKKANTKVNKKMESILTPLRYLAHHKEASVEEIAKETGKNYSTILRTITELIEKGLVDYHHERTAPRGKELRIYSANLYGLIFYWNGHFSSLDIKDIAEAHEDMLLVFKKWEKFTKAKCEPYMLARIASAVTAEVQFHSQQYNMLMVVAGLRGADMINIFRKSEEPARRAAFDVTALGFNFMALPVEHVKEFLGKQQWQQLEKIWAVVESDYELRAKRDEFLDRLERDHVEGLKAIAEWRKYLEQEQTSPK
jgi:DNA-binding transcriptional ArsR family regulator